MLRFEKLDGGFEEPFADWVKHLRRVLSAQPGSRSLTGKGIASDALSPSPQLDYGGPVADLPYTVFPTSQATHRPAYTPSAGPG